MNIPFQTLDKSLNIFDGVQALVITCVCIVVFWGMNKIFKRGSDPQFLLIAAPFVFLVVLVLNFCSKNGMGYVTSLFFSAILAVLLLNRF
jgi:hypothetical protein